ncbi:hypothetical protein J5N97_028713 [Dioscorea zingiberensis]|uniref:Sec-independent protein translocase protein TATB, chloroplastic n=1 Tax=Dioscorea zingiberensis TaxID=325984 RepID=A0A9D5BZ38_9LILI|nr:hypothetical protein J5N97_028713 [Dioscorea zingiberensis]
MASAVAPTIPTVCSVASNRRASSLFSNPPVLLVSGSTTRFRAYGSLAQTALGSFSSWHGLKHNGIPLRRDFIHKGRKEKCRGPVVHASLFGVGAPEALVIGVVALLVFGPKGLAEVARNLGKTLRAFQPTIKELQDVSREFKSTLEREIGLDDVASSANNTYRPTSSVGKETQLPAVDPNGATTRNPIEDLMKLQAVVASDPEAQPEGPGPAPTPATSVPAPTPTPTTSEAVSSPLASETAASPEAAAQATSSEKTDS